MANFGKRYFLEVLNEGIWGAASIWKTLILIMSVIFVIYASRLKGRKLKKKIQSITMFWLYFNGF